MSKLIGDEIKEIGTRHHQHSNENRRMMTGNVWINISAETPTSFDKNTAVRPVTENCNTLGFTSKGFSAEPFILGFVSEV